MKSEKRYLTWIAVTIAALILLGLMSFVYSSIEIIQKGLNEAFFELTYLAVHIIMLVTGLVLSLKALKEGESHIMRSLMFSGRGVSTASLVVSLSLSVIFLGLSLYSGLMFLGTVPLIFHFNKVLLLVVFNSSFFVATLGLYFSFYPKIVKDSF